MKTVVFAYHDMGCLGIEALLAAGYEISAIFTHTDNPGEKAFYGSVARLAAERGIPVYAPDNVNHPLWVERIAQLSPDVIFSFYYRHLIYDEILQLAPAGAFNLHGSLLPKYRGRAPLNWVLVNGETETGVTLHRMVKRADAGAIVAQLRIAIAPDDIAITLHHKLCHAARQLLEQTLPAIKHGNILEIAQRENEATCFGRRTPDDSFLEWHKPASVLHNMVRAVADPWPGAFSYVGNQKFTVWSSRVHPHASKAQPGSVISVAPLLIACGDGALEIVTGQAGDGITMQGSQLAQTLGLVQGSRLNSQPACTARRRTRVLILGVNGFIGNHLTERLLREDHYEVYGLDIGSDAISRFLNHPFEDLVIYEMHVRGFTRDASSGVKAPGTFEGLREKIPYLKDLGINAVELMPVFEFDEMESTRVVDGERLYNYWGYNTVCFFAPNTSYTSVVEHNHEGDELKELIYELKENGIEVILDVVFNHTAEGNEHGPCFSFKGIDNDIYYILTPDGYYYNFSGCGNVMNCNHPAVRRFIIDCLRYWVTEYRVDGFRFDLASILTRDEKGTPMADPPLLQAIACDAILGKVKLIAEAWDAGGLYQVGSFPSWNRWSEWNGRYRDDIRQFLKGTDGMAGTAITRITGSKDLYPEHRGDSASVNFVTCHDGFTLYDLYAYNTKHNEKNGWNNSDGDNNGNSWNCGAEGETDDPQIEGLRLRMVKNACATLMCSRGPAMFYAGDEFCNTQFGNNNAYCQDNIISWLDWTRLEKYQEIHDFFRYMIAFREKYPILRRSTKKALCGLPEISIHNGFPWNGGTDYTSKLIGIMYAGRDDADTRDDIIFYGMNAYWETLVMQLPELPNNLQWKICVNTNIEYEDGKDVEAQTEFYYKKTLKVPPRSVVILVAE